MLLADVMTDALPRCRSCGQVLVGAEAALCHPCLDCLCPACGEDFADVEGQLCNGCHDEWVWWNDEKLADSDWLETDIMDSQRRFARQKQEARK